MKRQGMLKIATLVIASSAAAAQPAEDRTKPPAKAVRKAPPADPFMGEYVGTYAPSGGKAVRGEGKVVPLKGGSYKVVLLAEVPAGKKDAKPAAVRIELTGRAEGEGKAARLTFAGKADNAAWSGTIAGKKLSAKADTAGQAGGEFDLTFAVRKSPTEGLKCPKGAVVLLPLTEGPPPLDAWTSKKWKPMPGGVVEVAGGANTTVRRFGDMKLHVEFMLPYEPVRRGQGRGNSGVYIQCRYEIQILDSFGLVPRKNDCGALYRVAAPAVNACLPPLRWQTYDITFRRPRADAQGKLLEPGRVTVLHNGILIHKDQQFTGSTGAGAKGFVPRAPLKLQDHGHPVRFRNIWLVDLEAAAKP